MSSVKLALSFIRIPRLFVSLLLFPLVLGLLLTVVQLYVTGIMIQATKDNPGTMETRFAQEEEYNIVRDFLFGSGERIENLEVCRWEELTLEDGTVVERPPNEACMPDRLDAAVHVENPASFDASEFVKLFTGNLERLHICKYECQPDIVITPFESTRISSVFGLAVLNLSRLNTSMKRDILSLAKTRSTFLDMLGEKSIETAGFREPVVLNGLIHRLSLVLSIVCLVLVALWLALKAHRKVLDYFARSGALLPMVAAIGKRDFYLAIWFLTGLRVAAFLCAAVPLMIYTLLSFEQGSAVANLFGNDLNRFLVWLIALSASLMLATVVASIADLKHRHVVFAFVYKYLPLILSFVGVIFWAVSFLMPDAVGGVMRPGIASLPIVGLGPILIAPIFEPSFDVLVAHALLSALVCLVLLRSNSRWFAAHLENL